jgi:hypothetical protein
MSPRDTAFWDAIEDSIFFFYYTFTYHFQIFFSAMRHNG